MARTKGSTLEPKNVIKVRRVDPKKAENYDACTPVLHRPPKPKDVIEKLVVVPSKKPIPKQVEGEGVHQLKAMKPAKKVSPVWDFLSSHFELQNLTWEEIGERGRKFSRSRRHLVCRECHSLDQAIGWSTVQESKGSKPYKPMHEHLATHGIFVNQQ